MWMTWRLHFLKKHRNFFMNLVWPGWIFSHEVRHVAGSCCGGCDLTKAAFPPTNPSQAVWTIAQPPRIALLLSSLSLFLSLICVSYTHTLSVSLTYTHFMLRHSRNFPLSSGGTLQPAALSIAVYGWISKTVSRHPFSSNPLFLTFSSCS